MNEKIIRLFKIHLLGIDTELKSAFVEIVKYFKEVEYFQIEFDGDVYLNDYKYYFAANKEGNVLYLEEEFDGEYEIRFTYFYKHVLNKLEYTLDPGSSESIFGSPTRINTKGTLLTNSFMSILKVPMTCKKINQELSDSTNYYIVKMSEKAKYIKPE